MPYEIRWSRFSDDTLYMYGPTAPRQIGAINKGFKRVGPAWITQEELFNNNVASVLGRRTVKLQAIVVPAGGGRQTAPNPYTGPPLHGGQGDVNRGHLMAVSNGGPDVPGNIVPQWGLWQQSGPWRDMEKLVWSAAVHLHNAVPTLANGAGYVAASPVVYYEVEVQYGGFDNPLAPYDATWTRRPNRFVPASPTLATWQFPSSFRVNAFRTAGDMQVYLANGPAPLPAPLVNFLPEHVVLKGGPKGIRYT